VPKSSTAIATPNSLRLWSMSCTFSKSLTKTSCVISNASHSDGRQFPAIFFTRFCEFKPRSWPGDTLTVMVGTSLVRLIQCSNVQSWSVWVLWSRYRSSSDSIFCKARVCARRRRFKMAELSRLSKQTDMVLGHLYPVIGNPPNLTDASLN